jgi:hypothetical protein
MPSSDKSPLIHTMMCMFGLVKASSLEKVGVLRRIRLETSPDGRPIIVLCERCLGLHGWKALSSPWRHTEFE